MLTLDGGRCEGTLLLIGQYRPAENEDKPMTTWTEDNVQIGSWRGVDYAEDEARWPDDARYRLKGFDGVAWFTLGWEVEPDEDTEWTGIVHRTGRVLAVMVGDDRVESFDPDELVLIGELEYCAVCGQIGCCHDGRIRD